VSKSATRKAKRNQLADVGPGQELPHKLRRQITIQAVDCEHQTIALCLRLYDVLQVRQRAVFECLVTELLLVTVVSMVLAGIFVCHLCALLSAQLALGCHNWRG
jgi:hypothetical protein